MAPILREMGKVAVKLNVGSATRNRGKRSCECGRAQHSAASGVTRGSIWANRERVRCAPRHGQQMVVASLSIRD